MERALRVSDVHMRVRASERASRQPALATAVGASYAFDPGADGLASIYAARVLERGVDPRALCADLRADELGHAERGTRRRALMTRTHTNRFGRGTAAHLQSQTREVRPLPINLSAPNQRVSRAGSMTSTPRRQFQGSWSRKIAAAG
jgi:hypothetical protein